MGRQLATRLLVINQQLHVMAETQTFASPIARQRWSTNVTTTNGMALRSLPPLQIGDRVLLKLDNEKSWSQPSTVVRSDPMNRSYIVRTKDGVDYRRNRRHLQSASYVPLCDDEAPESSDGILVASDAPLAVNVPAKSLTHTRCRRTVSMRPMRYR